MDTQTALMTTQASIIAAQSYLDRRNRDLLAEQGLDFATRCRIPGDKRHGAVPMTADRRADATFADHVLIDPGILPRFGRNGVTQYAVGGAGPRIGPHRQRQLEMLMATIRNAHQQGGVTALAQGLHIAHPTCPQNVFGAGVTRFEPRALEE